MELTDQLETEGEILELKSYTPMFQSALDYVGDLLTQRQAVFFYLWTLAGVFHLFPRLTPLGSALFPLVLPYKPYRVSPDYVSVVPVFVAAFILMVLMETSRPVLHSLSVSNTKLYRHFLPLTLNLCGLLLPLTTVYFLLHSGSLDPFPFTWSLAILGICLVTAIQALGNISNYIILTWDCYQVRENPFTEELEFHLNFLQDAVKLVYTVAVIMSSLCENCLSAPFLIVTMKIGWFILGESVPVWSEISQSFSPYLTRRTRLRKLSSSLTRACHHQLAQHGDVCSICYLDLETPQAVITPCRHLFHLVCLKKWVIRKDRNTCPFCTSPIIVN